MASLTPISEADASERFDKQALLQFHDLTRHRLENIPADIFPSHLYFTDSIDSSGTASLVPLERLNPISLTIFQSHLDFTDSIDSTGIASWVPLERLDPISLTIFQSHLDFTDSIDSSGIASLVPLERLDPIYLTELQVWQVHRGRVLYGTLCAEAFRTSGIIMTMLEDDNGDAVRLAIYNAADSQTNMKSLYPSGAKLAIRDPYFKRAGDGSLAIRIENPANIEMHVTQKEKCTESLPHVDVDELRKKGNTCFKEKRWDAAIEHYTKCIDAALVQLKKRCSNDKNNIIPCLLHAYSNRAAIRLRMKEFEKALEDSNEAFQIDSSNLKPFFTKGRALVGLRQYAAACQYLEIFNKAYPGHKQIQDVPGHKQIQDVLRQAKALHAQSRDGKYDISDSLLGLETPPDVADFFGPVEIKMTEDGRGRGLYATREISTGQLLLVSNAVAVAYDEDNDRSASWAWINVDHQGNCINLSSQEDLVVAVVSAAKKSQRLLQQLYSLDDYSSPVSLDAPAIDLFKTQGQISQSQDAAGKEKLQIDVNRIRNIIRRNSFVGAEQTFASKSKTYEAKLVQRGQNFSGLWLLLSFINHSCLPNSTRMAVGSAMFIHASKPIKLGEEITISYFDTLVPLLQRQARCKSWGFNCKCRRCILEFSLKVVLEPITSRFEQLYNKALEETNAGRSKEHFDRNLQACAEFAKLFVEAEEIIRSSVLLKAEEERNWIRASFVSAYLAGTQSNDFFPPDCIPSAEEVMEAIQNTVPGDIRTLGMVAQQSKKANRIMGDESQAFIRRNASEQARDACIRVFGMHSKDVIEALVAKHSNCHLF